HNQPQKDQACNERDDNVFVPPALRSGFNLTNCRYARYAAVRGFGGQTPVSQGSVLQSEQEHPRLAGSLSKPHYVGTARRPGPLRCHRQYFWLVCAQGVGGIARSFKPGPSRKEEPLKLANDDEHEGPQSALVLHYMEIRERLIRFFTARTGSPSEAEDVVQE